MDTKDTAAASDIKDCTKFMKHEISHPNVRYYWDHDTGYYLSCYAQYCLLFPLTVFIVLFFSIGIWAFLWVSCSIIGVALLLFSYMSCLAESTYVIVDSHSSMIHFGKIKNGKEMSRLISDLFKEDNNNQIKFSTVKTLLQDKDVQNKIKSRPKNETIVKCLHEIIKSKNEKSKNENTDDTKIQIINKSLDKSISSSSFESVSLA